MDRAVSLPTQVEDYHAVRQDISAYKLEFLALKWAITEKFHDYLYGNYFRVVTDNNPLRYILTTAKLDATSYRWLASLSTFFFFFFFFFFGLSVAQITHDSTYAWLYYHHSQPFFFFFFFFFFLI